MKKVKVSIQDEHTLVLQEAGDKGDVIDLSALHEMDIDQTTITNVVNSIKKDAFAEALRKEREALEQKMALEAKLDGSKKDTEIAELKSQLRAVEQQAATEKQLAVTEATASLKESQQERMNRLEKERDALANELKNKESEKELLAVNLKDKYETQIKDREDTIERLKEMKAKLSVKLVGENLEQHCQNEFNAVRAGQFPYAYFEKDNEAVKDVGDTKGTKGDFVYRDYDQPDGTEIISIMFEMKDEQDASTSKRTVESHLEKLDKDRKKKGLEYAVLVTLLEAENEFTIVVSWTCRINTTKCM